MKKLNLLIGDKLEGFGFQKLSWGDKISYTDFICSDKTKIKDVTYYLLKTELFKHKGYEEREYMCSYAVIVSDDYNLIAYSLNYWLFRENNKSVFLPYKSSSSFYGFIEKSTWINILKNVLTGTERKDYWGYYRKIRTTQERRYATACEHKPYVRGRRSFRSLPNTYDDLRYTDEKTWKARHKVRKQWEVNLNNHIDTMNLDNEKFEKEINDSWEEYIKDF